MKAFIVAFMAFLSVNVLAENSHEGKVFDLGASPIGFYAAGDVAISMELFGSYHFTDDDLVSLRFQVLPPYGSDYSTSMTGVGASLLYQRYLSDSFNVKVGLSQGSFETSKRPGSSSSNPKIYFKSRVTAIEGRIGNQWTWGSFTMGADWFGYAIPILTTVVQDDGSFSNQPPTSILRFVQFFVGFSF